MMETTDTRPLREALAAAESEIADLRQRLEQAEKTWRCFHCGFETASPQEAAAHFGDRDDAEEFTPTCTWWSKLSAEEKAQQFQDLQGELNAERDESGQLSMKVEGLEHRLVEFEHVIDSRFKGCRSINDIFHLYDTLEGRMLVEKERAQQAEQRAAAAEEALEPLRGAGDRRVLPGCIVFAEGFFDRVLDAARGAKGGSNE